MTRRRLDVELVRRHLARSREQAQEFINAGHVKVGGIVATKPATMVGDNAAIKISDQSDSEWVSRGAHKLLGALEAFRDGARAARAGRGAAALDGRVPVVDLPGGKRTHWRRRGPRR